MTFNNLNTVGCGADNMVVIKKKNQLWQTEITHVYSPISNMINAIKIFFTWDSNCSSVC